MTRYVHVAFGVVAYLIFFATFLYLIAFVANAPFVPRTVDRGPEIATMTAVVTNVALIALFGLQHSVMARQGFKAAWTRIIPKPIERSMYVLITSIILCVLFNFWKPIPATLWSVENSIGAGLIWALFATGWVIVLLSTMLISHFELFGLKQVWSNLRGAGEVAPTFRQPLFYKFVRHPLYSGFLLAFWAIPVMTIGHALFAAGMTVYILIAISYEERDLIGLFGDDYVAYRAKVGKLVPRI